MNRICDCVTLQKGIVISSVRNLIILLSTCYLLTYCYFRMEKAAFLMPKETENKIQTKKSVNGAHEENMNKEMSIVDANLSKTILYASYGRQVSLKRREGGIWGDWPAHL